MSAKHTAILERLQAQLDKYAIEQLRQEVVNLSTQLENAHRTIEYMEHMLSCYETINDEDYLS